MERDILSACWGVPQVPGPTQKCVGRTPCRAWWLPRRGGRLKSKDIAKAVFFLASKSAYSACKILTVGSSFVPKSLKARLAASTYPLCPIQKRVGSLRLYFIPVCPPNIISRKISKKPCQDCPQVFRRLWALREHERHIFNGQFFCYIFLNG